MTREQWLGIDLPALRSRLLTLGWTQLGGDPNLLTAPDGSVARVPIGLPEKSRESALRGIFEYFASQASLLTVEEVIEQYASGHDVVFVGIESPQTTQGLLPMRRSESFYGQWESILKHAAAAEVMFSPKGSHRVSKDAETLMERAYWGRTAKGSYLHAIHLPLDSYSTEPLGRRAWHRIVRCLESIREATKHNSNQPLLDLGRDGWSATLCESVADLVLKTNATNVRVAAIPDESRPDTLRGDVPVQLDVPTSEDLTVPMLNDTALSLRGIAPYQEQILTGRIFAISDPSRVGDDGPQEVRFKWVQDDGTELRVSLRLMQEEMATAELAYVQEIPITVKGVLKRTNRYFIEDPKEFGILT